MLSGGSQSARPPPSRGPSRPQDPYYNKPPPPASTPSQGRRDDRYGPEPGRQGSYGSSSYAPSDHRYDDRQRYDERDRYDDRRYDDRDRYNGRNGGSGGGGGGGYGSPPPQSYGFQSLGPPPAAGSHGRPSLAASQRPPPTPAPPPPRDGNDREALWPIFKAVDKNSTSSTFRALAHRPVRGARSGELENNRG